MLMVLSMWLSAMPVFVLVEAGSVLRRHVMKRKRIQKMIQMYKILNGSEEEFHD